MPVANADRPDLAVLRAELLGEAHLQLVVLVVVRQALEHRDEASRVGVEHGVLRVDRFLVGAASDSDPEVTAALERCLARLRERVRESELAQRTDRDSGRSALEQHLSTGQAMILEHSEPFPWLSARCPLSGDRTL